MLRAALTDHERRSSSASLRLQVVGYEQVLDTGSSVKCAALVVITSYYIVCPGNCESDDEDATNIEDYDSQKGPPDSNRDVLTGVTGEAAVYKRRGMAKPMLGRSQVKCVPVSCSSRSAHGNEVQAKAHSVLV